jgi:hypothetical protein
VGRWGGGKRGSVRVLFSFGARKQRPCEIYWAADVCSRIVEFCSVDSEFDLSSMSFTNGKS